MKSLYREEDWRYTPEGEDLDRQTNKVIRQIFQQYLDDGFNSREIAHIMCLAVTDLELSAVLDRKDGKTPVVANPGT